MRSEYMIAGIIPARWASTRFPGKLGADLEGKPLLQWTWERAKLAGSLDRVIIAAGDEQISELSRGFGAEVEEVFEECQSGSDRISRVIDRLADRGEQVKITVNIQGDEPLLDPQIIDKTVSRLLSSPNAGVATPVARIKEKRDYLDSSVVKVVMDSKNSALYFTRSPVPEGWSLNSGKAYRHIGLYAYRTEILKAFTRWAPCEMEITERLEQLRLLYNGVNIAVVEVEEFGVGVDTIADLERVRSILQKRNQTA